MRRRPDRRRRLGVSAVIVAAAMLVGAVTASARRTGPVTAWANHNAIPLATVDPTAPLDDLTALAPSVGDAQIVGLGEAVHGASELLTLKHRTLRFLVEQMGFRSIAWEEDWTTGLEIDRYIRTGEGDLDAIVREMSPQWPTQEVANVLRWLRDYNAGHSDQVRFFGVEHYFTRLLAYDAVEAYVAGVAPERTEELREHLRVIRPFTADKFEYVQWYMAVDGKTPYIRHAHAVLDLVQDVAQSDTGPEGQIAVHHARQIVSFYEHYNLSFDEANMFREARAAENLRWWQELTGDRVVYWAASPHTANAPRLRIVQPEGPEFRFPSAGSHLRRWYGDQYLSIGFTFDHGTVSLGPGATAAMPPPDPEWFEHPLGQVGYEHFALDLRRRAPRPVHRWLHDRITTRGLADSPGGFMTGGTLAQWFDVLVHRQEVSPAHPDGAAT